MALQIRKRVSLSFLGDEYKDSFLVFRSVPLKDFEKIQEEASAIGDDGKKSIAFISDKLKEYFISGKAANDSGTLEDVSKDDLDNLDQESVLKCFEALTGQAINEESNFLDNDSNKPSSTEAKTSPSNS